MARITNELDRKIAFWKIMLTRARNAGDQLAETLAEADMNRLLDQKLTDKTDKTGGGNASKRPNQPRRNRSISD